MASDSFAEACEIVDSIVGDQAESWDLAGLLPSRVLADLGGRGLLCPQVPETYGGLGFDSSSTGRLTAHVGARCSSLRSVMTSQGMAAWTIQRLGDMAQRHAYLSELTAGKVAAVGFSEPDAGSDLSAITTRIKRDGDHLVLSGSKVWVTAADYADLLVVFGQFGDGAAAVVVPTASPGVTVTKVADPLGCRAAGHADVEFDSVRLTENSLLGGSAQSLQLLVTTALTYGRLSVAWGCVGILRSCLAEATRHARTREQFGKPLAQHQLTARNVAELLTAEHIATRSCEYASQCWDAKRPEMVTAAVMAKYVSAQHAVRGAATAVQVLASAGARDGRPVARAYRDAKLMEIIEGSSEICQLILAEQAFNASYQV
ncbi:acyl-CoA dehydrogenase family protein [Nocardia sp. NPDC046473]|uniref:acyl-CoA dehydrogenase family protein n=1 Tax=Nocardia sp. NPDC046473 TaxID=3155733 RepID=UPI0033E92435